jgi:hypothetical protein
MFPSASRLVQPLLVTGLRADIERWKEPADPAVF